MNEQILSEEMQQNSLPSLDGSWEKSDRSLNAAATFGLFGVGAIYFTAQSVLLIIAIVINQIVSSAGKQPVKSIDEMTSFIRAYGHSIQIALLISQYCFMLVPTIWLVKRWHTMNVKSYIRFEFKSVWQILLAVVGTLAILPTSIFIENAVMRFFPMPDIFRKMGEEIFKAYSFEGFLWLILVVCITPAICEETLFRGYVQRTFERTMGWKSVLLVGVIFGLYHMQPLGLISLSMLGIFLGYLFYRSKSLLPSMAAHFTNNFIAIYLLYKTPKIGGIDLAGTAQIPVVWLIVSVVLTLLIITIYEISYKKYS